MSPDLSVINRLNRLEKDFSVIQHFFYNDTPTHRLALDILMITLVSNNCNNSCKQYLQATDTGYSAITLLCQPCNMNVYIPQINCFYFHQTTLEIPQSKQQVSQQMVNIFTGLTFARVSLSFCQFCGYSQSYYK